MTPSPRAAVFDIGDTLLSERSLRYEAMESALKAMEQAGLISSGHEIRENYLAADRQLSGFSVNHLFSNVDMVRKIFDEAGYSNSDHLSYCFVSWHREHVVSCVQPNKDLREMFKRLRDRGWRVGILTDGTALEQYFLLNRLGVLEFVDRVTVSELMGVSKPSPLIFQDILKKLSTLAKRTIMIGNDVERDIRGALQSGMLAIQIVEHVHDNSEEVNCPRLGSILEVDAKLEECLPT